MRLEPTAIEGVVLVALEAHDDERGSFTELYRREWLPGSREMVQANLSVSRAGVLRGMHYHREQADYWVLLEGEAVVGLHDLRADSASRARAATLRLAAADGLRGLSIPPGVAHGFWALTDVRLAYLVDRAFTGADEHGVAWDDPGLGIDWPPGVPVLSARDRSNPSLDEVLRRPPGGPQAG
jgi:dTDP-4-dehydrorhamnose 3,5-epimerase